MKGGLYCCYFGGIFCPHLDDQSSEASSKDRLPLLTSILKMKAAYSSETSAVQPTSTLRQHPRVVPAERRIHHILEESQYLCHHITTWITCSLFNKQRHFVPQTPGHGTSQHTCNSGVPITCK